MISQIDLFEGGSVLLPESAPWLDAFIGELVSFPGRHDDQVDALVQGTRIAAINADDRSTSNQRYLTTSRLCGR